MKLLLTAAALVLGASASGLPSQDDLRIKNLPGLDPSFSQAMYSGVVPVNGGDHKLFFWGVEAKTNPSERPLAFWFTGGPGCSSLSALMTEQGPFWPNSNYTVSADADTWTGLFNMVWVDSPAGVGFSTADTPYTPNDGTTADDAYDFIQKYLTIFPEYQGRATYITGESYGGHYVPNLAVRILQGNAAAKARNTTDATTVHVNLEGIMVGNPWTVPAVDNEGAVDFWAGHNIITEADAKAIKSSCDFAAIGPLDVLKNAGVESRTTILTDEHVGAIAAAASNPFDCQTALEHAMENFKYINIYDVYEDLCVGKPLIPPLLAAHAPSRAPLSAIVSEGQALRSVLYQVPPVQPPNPPCGIDWANDFLNDAAVQSAIHAPSMRYHVCSTEVSRTYRRADVLSSVMDKYVYMLRYMQSQDGSKFKFLVYSGDVDGILPFIGTRRWVESLGLRESTTHTPWLANNQTGGWVRSYFDKRVVFATVRDAGHMVPGTQPFRGFMMMKRFLDGTLTNGGPYEGPPPQ